MLRKTLMAAAAAALLAPMAASAQSFATDDLTVTGNREVRREIVLLRDLDLRNDRDVRKADNRVRRAAARVCSAGRLEGSVVPLQSNSCYIEAFNDARVELNSAIADVRA